MVAEVTPGTEVCLATPEWGAALCGWDESAAMAEQAELV